MSNHITHDSITNFAECAEGRFRISNIFMRIYGRVLGLRDIELKADQSHSWYRNEAKVCVGWAKVVLLGNQI